MELEKFHRSIPTWKDGKWVQDTVFDDLIKFRDFVKSTFKEPGKYELDETAEVFNEQARAFKKQGNHYCLHIHKGRDFRKYWDNQKQKCREGVIFHNNGKTWYLPRDYYMWINFLPIYDKVKKRFDFAHVWDVQIHMALYEELAELHFKHASILKKRQIASSYFHMAKVLNRIWFEEGAIIKIGASLKDYISLAGSWKFLEEYKAFLNGKTAWYRPMNPGKVLEWQQKIEITKNDRKIDVGLKGMITGMSFEQSDTKGVGGPCTIFFYEEAGVAPRMDKTFEFIRPAMQAGDITTGLFVAAGSVGELAHCEPLKDMTLKPDDNDIYGVETDLIDDTGVRGVCGLFIPEQWGMPPHIDEFGNSLVESALASLDEKFEHWKKTLSASKYQLRISQHPRNIKEAFAHREQSKFPTELVEHNKMEIKDNAYPFELIELDESMDGSIVVNRTTKPPVDEWPVQKSMDDKEGSIVIWERPDLTATWGTYVGSIDPVAEGKTVTSESLCSIYIYKMATQIQRYTENGVTNFIEGGKVVAAWCGRFDDINNTHKRLRLILEWFNAWAIVENNVSLFIQYMIGLSKQKYLVPKSQILFLKEIQANKTVYQEYGWKNTGTIFKAHILSYLIEFVKEVVEEDVDDFGRITKKYYGIKRIPDIMAMEEMLGYADGVNVDRLIALGALIAFVKIQESNTRRPVKVENDIGNNLQNSQNLYKLKSHAFRNLGKSGRSGGMQKKRSPFKRIS